MSARFDHVFWDLDGTLTDSAPGILNACGYALSRLGVSLPREECYVFIGPPLLETFTRVTGSAEGGREGVRLYREYFSARGIFENSVYPGIPEALAAVAAAGRKNVLATAKPLVFARRILDHFDLTRHFACVGGADLDGPVHGKADVLRLDLDATGADPSRVLMIGDRRDDVDAARGLRLACCGVTYGYAAPGEIDHADFLCATPAEAAACALQES